MYFGFDFDRMEDLLKNFFVISNIRYSLMDKDAKIMCVSSGLSPFCDRMNACAEGHSRCKQCDTDAIARALMHGYNRLTYRCHAGLLETLIPIRQNGDVLGFIFFGQVIHADDPERQWCATRALIDWMPDADALREAFYQQRRMDDPVIDSCAKILEACSSYILMRGIIRTSAMSDEQLLNRFIEENYSEPLKLDDIAASLSMSKTKLCGVAARQGTTVKTLLNNRRMEEAKRMLRHGDDRISEVANLVGLCDYNYFTKQFKAYTGETPRAYQDRHRRSKRGGQ